MERREKVCVYVEFVRGFAIWREEGLFGTGVMESERGTSGVIIPCCGTV